jgi:hypothetical protein
MIKGGPRVVTDGLVLCLDAHDAKSYAGEPTSNLIPNVANPNLSTSGWYSTGWNGNISTDTDEGALVLNATNGWRSMSYDFGVTNGTVTVQFDYKLKSAEHTNIFMIVLNGTHLGSYTQLLDNYIYPSISEYKTYKKTFTTTTDSKICIVLRGTDNAGLTDEMFVKNLQVESKSYSTPFVAGSRSATNGWVDRSGNSNSGTLVNGTNTGVSHYRDGQVIMPVANSYLDFDGTNDQIQVDNIPQIFDGSVTMESWFFWDDDSRSIIFGNYNQGAGGHDVNFEKLTSRVLRIYWNRGERDVTTSANVVTTSGEWQHVVMVRDASNNNFRFYVNGSLIQTTSNAGSNITSTGSTFRIGADTRDGTTVTNGGVGVLRLYNKALTAAEVLSNYNATKGRFS